MKKGFTLIELLGVIIILAILTMLVLPKVVNSVRNSFNKPDAVTLEIIYDAAELYMSNHSIDFPKSNRSKFFIPLKDLVADGLLATPIKLSDNDSDITYNSCVQVVYDDKYEYELKSGDICNKVVIDLVDGLTPIKYNGSNWEVVDIKDDWYNYSKQEWANAAILSEGVSKTPGTQLIDLNNQVKAMFVYIPRYEYRIQGDYGKGGSSASLPGEIEVNFISMSQKKVTSGYTVHPAFTFGKKELYGIWVGKFELSHITAETQDKVDENLQNKDCDSVDSLGNSICHWTSNSLSCTDENCDESDEVRILPNVSSLRYNDVSTFFYTIRSMSRDGNGFGVAGNTHMIKNSEWGAIAFLSQSEYGKYGNDNYKGENKEIYQNKSLSFITGSSNGTPPHFAVADNQCTYDDFTNNCGIGASTTGNITGVYDMSGGAHDLVMAKNNKSESDNIEDRSGFIELPESKYYDYYLEYGNGETCLTKKNHYEGHAMWELSRNCNSTQYMTFTTWYGDQIGYSGDYNGPWFSRGGSVDASALDSPVVGIFYAAEIYEQGGATAYYSTRVVLVSD